MKKRIVILGNANSIFIYNYCREVLSGDYDVSIISVGDGGIYKDRYEKLNVEICVRPKKEELLSLNRFAVKKHFKIINEFKHKKIDVLHVHFVSIGAIMLYFPLWKKAERKILTFWGSDLFLSVKPTKVSKYFIASATFCVLMIEQNINRFIQLFGNDYLTKVKIIDFGNSNIEYIDNVRGKKDKQKCKSEYGIDADKFVIHLGYNASKHQNHMDMIRCLNALSEEVKRNIICVLPMNYAKTEDYEEYKKDLRNELNICGIEYRVVEDFLEKDSLASFRLMADLFVLGHLTDGMSDSPMEYAYANVPILCKKEVADNYIKVLGEKDDGFIVYNSYEEIPQITMDIVMGKREIIADCTRSRRKKIELAKSWKICKYKWRELYDGNK